MSIGVRIKTRRTQLKMSQRELANKMGYSNHSTIARIESGKVDIPQSKIVQFADALRTSVAYLMEWDSYRDEDRNAVRIGNIVKQLRDRRQLSVQEFADELGLTEEEIRNYENGEDKISIKLVRMLADYFNISEGSLTTANVKSDDIFATITSTNDAYVWQIKKWVEIFGNERFDDKEFYSLVEYGKFILYQRKHKDY